MPADDPSATCVSWPGASGDKLRAGGHSLRGSVNKRDRWADVTLAAICLVMPMPVAVVRPIVGIQMSVGHVAVAVPVDGELARTSHHPNRRH